MSDEAKEVGNLVASAGKEGEVLRYVSVDGRRVALDAVDNLMLLVHKVAGDLLNIPRHGSRVKKGLTVLGRRKVLADGVEVVAEADLEDRVGLVKDQLECTSVRYLSMNEGSQARPEHCSPSPFSQTQPSYPAPS